MKKTAAVILILCMLLGFAAACRKEEASEPVVIELGAGDRLPIPKAGDPAEPTDMAIEGTQYYTDPEEDPSGTPEPKGADIVTLESYAAYINGSRVNFRSEPSREAEVLGVFDKGSSVTVIGEGEEWFRIIYAGTEGYVAEKYVTAGEAPTPAPTPIPFKDIDGKAAFIDGNGVNMRSEPNTESEVLCRFSRGDTVKLTGEWGDWYRIEANGKEGYVASRFVKEGVMPTPSPTPIPVESMERTKAHINRYGVNFREAPRKRAHLWASSQRELPSLLRAGRRNGTG